MSKHGYHTKKGYGEVKTKIKTGEDVYQDNLYQLNNDKDKAIQQIRVRQSRLRPNEQQAYQELQDQIKQIMSDYEVKKQQAMASLKTPEAKKANTQGGQTRALMNTFIPTGKMSDLTGKNVVIVDDNVNSGGTIARMVKAILRQGAKPQSFSAITIHLFEA
jgi:predicted amidophosphoribosyltransferase